MIKQSQLLHAALLLAAESWGPATRLESFRDMIEGTGWVPVDDAASARIGNDKYLADYIEAELWTRELPAGERAGDVPPPDLDFCEARSFIEKCRLLEGTQPKSSFEHRAFRERASNGSSTYEHPVLPDAYIYIFDGLSYRDDRETALSFHVPRLLAPSSGEFPAELAALCFPEARSFDCSDGEYLFSKSCRRYPEGSRDHTSYKREAFFLFDRLSARIEAEGLEISSLFLHCGSFDIFV